MKKLSLLLVAVLILVASLPAVSSAEEIYPGFRVEGRFLYDNTGEKVIPYGVNEMTIWGDVDGDVSFAEIAKTGANTVRIVWGITGDPRKLDVAIYNCRKSHMIPMIELHDATGEWSKLPELVDYWVRPDVVEVIKKHQEYLLINIGNEVGQNVSESDFKSGYKTAVNRMREAGIHVPLIIDGGDWGKDINVIQAAGAYLIDADPDHNLMFSVHMWWPYMWGYDEKKVTDEIAETVRLGLPLIVGEFADKWEETENGKIPYKTIMEQCYKNEIGYLIWSWGPGNQPQTFLDMTADGTFATLKPWAEEMCITDTYSIKNISKRPASMLSDPPEMPMPTIPEGSISLNKPVFASSVETSANNVAGNAVDGNLGTRWSSEYSDPQYIYVDLEKEHKIGSVYIEWETAHARQYKIQVSNDAKAWTDVFTEYNGDGGLDEIELSVTARYVRIYCMQRATEWGHSIYEFQVYPEGGAVITPPIMAPGDVNNDGSVNSTDYALVKRHILGTSLLAGEALQAADVNRDENVNSTDYAMIKRYILGSIAEF
jgi:mannan endo-1,4-beta-mannosidase